MKTCRLSILRHGLTRANLEGYYAGGGTDWPLAPEGASALRQLKAQWPYPQVEAVFVSPLQRCIQTAEILYPGVKQYVIQDLREAHFGEFEGRRAVELAGEAAFRRWMDPHDDYTPAGGENGNVFAARTRGVLMKMLEFMLKSGLGDAACVTHGGVAMSMLAQRALPQRPAAQWACDPGCGYQVQADAALWMRDGLVEARCILPLGYRGAPLPGQEEEDEEAALAARLDALEAGLTDAELNEK